jgi:hypothetical protein
MTSGMRTVVYPVEGLGRAKTLYAKLLGVAPHMDDAYYVGFRVGDQELGLDPHGYTGGSRGHRVSSIEKEAQMALARVVTFEGVNKDRMEEMDREMREGQPPEGVPVKEIVVLHDPEAEKSVAILFFETEADYKKGDEVLNAMPAGDTPGKRTSVTKYNVATRMTN